MEAVDLRLGIVYRFVGIILDALQRDQRRQAVRPELAVDRDSRRRLKRLDRALGVRAELAVDLAGIIAHGLQPRLQLDHVRAIVAVAQDAVAERALRFVRTAVVILAVGQHDHRVPLGLGHEDVARAEIIRSIGVLGIRQLDKLARAHEHRRLRGGVEVIRHDARVSAADAHQPGAVRLARLIGLCRIKALVLDQIPERLVVGLVVPDVCVVARRPHGLGNLLRLGAVLRPQHNPSLRVSVPVLRADFLARLISGLPAGRLAALVNPRAANQYRHFDFLLTYRLWITCG